MLKHRIAALVALLALGATAYCQAVATADSLMREAEVKAGKEKKAVWVIFRASWCGWCKRLDAFMQDPANKKIIEKYFVPVHVTVLESDDKKATENPGGEQLMSDLNGKDQGLPFYAFVGSDGKAIVSSRMPSPQDKTGSNIGHPAKPEEIAWFMEMVKRAAPKMTATERATLENWLKNQKLG